MGILPCDVFALPQLAKLNETALNNSDPEKMKQEMTKRHASFNTIQNADDKGCWLVVWNIVEHLIIHLEYFFNDILGMIIPTDELIYISEGWLNQQPGWMKHQIFGICPPQIGIYQQLGFNPSISRGSAVDASEVAHVGNDVFEVEFLLVWFFSCI